MFRRVAMLWRVERKRQDAGAFANMVPAVSFSFAMQVNGMRQCIADWRSLQAEFRLVFRISTRLSSLRD
jgi:hypothetical protein